MGNSDSLTDRVKFRLLISTRCRSYLISGDVVEIYHFSLEDERPQKGETAKAAKIIKCWVVSLLDFIFESNFNL